MFEYLMPLLVMPTYDGTLLDADLRRRRWRGRSSTAGERGVPWGISESGYNTHRRAASNYQYRAFGVPGLGLKRGLADDLVVAPYATRAGADGRARTPRARTCAGWRATGWQGQLRLLRGHRLHAGARCRAGKRSAIGALVHGPPPGHEPAGARQRAARSTRCSAASTPTRVSAPPSCCCRSASRGAVDLPRTPPTTPRRRAAAPRRRPAIPRAFTTPDTPAPEVQLLSNGRYHVMVTNAGGGYSRWRDLAVTRWREDAHARLLGHLLLPARPARSGDVLVGGATSRRATRADQLRGDLLQGRAEFRRRDHGIETHTEIAVSPEDDIELRRVTPHQPLGTRRTIEVTSYAEVVLAPQAADVAHPAFSNLFVQTELVAERGRRSCARAGRARPTSRRRGCSTCSRRTAPTSASRSRTRPTACASSAAAARLGARRAAMDARALVRQRGPVLDPIVAIRAGSSRSNRERDGHARLRHRRRRRRARRASRWSTSTSDRHARRPRVRAGLDPQPGDAAPAQRHARPTPSSTSAWPARVLYADPALRAAAGVLARNRRGQSGLWGYAHLRRPADRAAAASPTPPTSSWCASWCRRHAYWRLKGLASTW